MRLLIRFRMNGSGVEVFNAGKWIVADETILTNIRDILGKMAY